MNCREIQELIYEVAFGDTKRSPAFDQHLEGCPPCRSEFVALEFAARGIEDIQAPPAPSLSNDRLRQAILSESLKTRPTLLPRLTLVGAAAALALAAWVGWPKDSSPADTEGLVAVTVDPPVVSGPIIIPEDPPEVIEQVEPPVVAAATQPTRRPARSVRTARVQPEPSDAVVIEYSEVPDDLLAVVVGGAEGALDSEFATERGGAVPPSAAAMGGSALSEKPEDPPIVVIQPKGQATERSSDDIPIGG